MENKSKRQHYLSQFYLRNFANPMGSKNLNVYFRNNGKWVTRTPKRIGWKSHQLTIVDDNGNYTDKYDRFITENIESPAAPIIQSISTAKNANLHDLSEEEIHLISMFISVIATRSPSLMESAFKSYTDSLATTTKKELEEAASQWRTIENSTNKTIDNFLKMIKVGGLFKWLPTLYSRILGWNWHLITTNQFNPFITSDRPVFAQQNDKNIKMIGFPISSEVALIISNGIIRSDCDSDSHIKAINYQTMVNANEFIVSSQTNFPGSDCIENWRKCESKLGFGKR
jgi:hypothetical protein